MYMYIGAYLFTFISFTISKMSAADEPAFKKMKTEDKEEEENQQEEEGENDDKDENDKDQD